MDKLVVRSGAASVKGKWIGVVLAAAALAPAAFGQGPPSMEAIEMPVDVDSVVTAVAAVGGSIFLAWAGLKVAFMLARKLVSRISRSV